MTIFDEVLIFIDDQQPVSQDQVFEFLTSTPKAVIASAIARLKKRGDITNIHEAKLICTPEGNQRIITTLQELESLRTSLSRTWFLCIFAVPEKNKVDREKLRLILRHFGFNKLRGGLFLAYKTTIDTVEQAVKREHLKNYVNFIHINELPQPFIDQYVIKILSVKELESESRALIADINEFFDRARTLDKTRQKVIAKSLVYRLALHMRKDPSIPGIETLDKQRSDFKTLYSNLKPYCYD